MVATNCDQHYERPLVAGDRLRVPRSSSRSPGRSRPGSGTGRLHHHTASTTGTSPGELGGQPCSSGSSSSSRAPGRPSAPDPQVPAAQTGRRRAHAAAPSRPHPGQLLLLRRRAAAQAADPALRGRAAPCAIRPGRRAPCRSFDWDTVEASRAGAPIYSFVVIHYPQVPAFDYPLVIALVELEEGTRLVANLVGHRRPATVGDRHGRSSAEFVDFDDELSLPGVPYRRRTRDEEGDLMDFTFNDEQTGRRARRRRDLHRPGRPRPGRSRSRPPTTGSTATLWAALARADLLGLAVPEAEGGAGLRADGARASCSRRRATRWRPCRCGPPWCSARCPSPHSAPRPSRPRSLPGVVAGRRDPDRRPHRRGATTSAVVRPAVGGPSGQGDGLGCSTGTALAVPQAHVATASLVPAWPTVTAWCVAARRPDAPGCPLERAVTTNREVHPHLHLDGVTVGADDVAGRADRGARRGRPGCWSAAPDRRCARSRSACAEAALAPDRRVPERASPVRRAR